MYKIAKKELFFLFKTIKLLWNSSKISFIITLIVSLINGLISPLTILISKYLIDSVVTAMSNTETKPYIYIVLFWLSIELIITIFSHFIQRVHTYYSIIQVDSLDNYISKLIIKKSNELDLSFFENNEFYDKIEKSNEQSAYSAMEIINSLMDLIKDITMLIGYIAIVIKLSPVMLCMCLVISIPMFIINLKISDYKYSVFSERIEKTRFAQYLKNLMLNYKSIKEIKINRLGNYFEKIISSIYKDNLDKDKEVEKERFSKLFLIDLLSVIISYCYKVYIVIMTIKKGLSIGSMTMYITAITNVDNSIKSTLDNMTRLYSNNLYIKNLFYVLELKPKIVNIDTAKNFNNKIEKCIEFKNVYFKYPGSTEYALKDVSFKIYSNQNCAIVGLNGCGKTTLVKLMMRLYEPDEGEILIDGINIKTFNLESLYKCINVVFQDFTQYPFSIKENIGFGDIDNFQDINKIRIAAEKGNSYDFIQSLDKKFDTKLGKLWSDGVELSLGQWQKLAISRAFMNESSILILDEPTASVDAETEYEMFKNFKKLVGNRTSLLISHRFSTVKMADFIVVLQNGQVIEKGTHVELLKCNGLYSKLYNMQAEGYIDKINELEKSY